MSAAQAKELLTGVFAESETTAYLEGLNERQRQAVLVAPNCPLQVLAGAGTGKTELISRRFAHLVHTLQAQGISNPTERILVVTFTVDAANAMRTRIQQRLSHDPHASPRLSVNHWIGTFHQICMRIIRQHPLEVGLPPQFSVLNPLEQDRLFQGVMQQVFAGQYVNLMDLFQRYELPSSLSPQVLAHSHLQATGIRDLEALLEPSRLLRLINRIKSAGLSPAEFRETARRQSKDLTQALLNLPIPHEKSLKAVDNLRLKIAAWRDTLRPWSATGWDPARMAEEKAALEGRDPDRMTASLYKAELPGLVTMHLAPRTFEPIASDPELLETAFGQELALIDIISGIYVLYQEALLAQGACDFDDLINHATRLLSQSAIGEKARQRFEAVIVDEFQDSNGSQLRLLSLLTRPHAGNLTVVGDEKQSIYGFRFAQPENLDLIFQVNSLSREERETNENIPIQQEAQRISLQTNYRSTPPVLMLANHLTDRLTTTSDSHLYPAQTLPEAPLVIGLSLDAPPDQNALALESSDIDFILPNEGAKNTTDSTSKKIPHKSIDEQRLLESRFIAVEISRLAQNENCQFSEIAILVSSHGRAAEIQRVLTDYGIPSVRQKNLGFFADPIIKTAMALLRLLRKPSDVTSLTRILQSKLNPKQIRSVLMWALQTVKSGEVRTITEACALLKTAPECLPSVSMAVAEAVGDLANHVCKVRRMRFELTAEALFERLAHPLGLIDSRLPEWRQKEQRIRLNTLNKLLQALRLAGGPSAPLFDDWMDTLECYAADPSLDLPVTEDPGDEDAVRIMTIFAAKGLEFKVVFAACTEIARLNRGGDGPTLTFDPQYTGKNGFGLILGKVNGQPNIKQEIYRKCWAAPRAERETQRVFYVALTRARERLYIIRGSRSFPWTDPSEAPPEAIRVLSEIRDADYLHAHYWGIDSQATRHTMEALQESRKSRMRGEIIEGG